MIKRMIIATAILFAVLLFMLPRTDEQSKKKMVSAAMLMCSNDFRKTVGEQLRRNESFETNFSNSCPDLIAALNVDEEGVMTIKGAQHNISLVLTPEIKPEKVHWSCRGEPAEAITKLCKP